MFAGEGSEVCEASTGSRLMQPSRQQIAHRSGYTRQYAVFPALASTKFKAKADSLLILPHNNLFFDRIALKSATNRPSYVDSAIQQFSGKACIPAHLNLFADYTMLHTRTVTRTTFTLNVNHQKLNFNVSREKILPKLPQKTFGC